MRFEQTIRAAVECSGVGLHSGVQVQMRMVPASPGSGIVFRRTDLDDFQVEATGRNVAKVSYATSLMKKGVLISTTEHVLSAFVGMGVDNAYRGAGQPRTADPRRQRAAHCGDGAAGGIAAAEAAAAAICAC